MADDPNTTPVDRRQLLLSGFLIAGAVVAPMAVWSRLRHGESGRATERQRLLLAVVCDLVIPKTDTPGAVQVGTAEFVELALSHGLNETRAFGAEALPAAPGAPTAKAEGGLYLLDALTWDLDGRCGGDFLKASPQRRLATLTALDAAAFAAPRGAEPPWLKIKQLILIGYYTSEAGGSQELQYELLPGRWDADLPLAPGTHAFSSDWTAVDFG